MKPHSPERTRPASNTLTINRAPVMTLWASVVAQRLGHSAATSLSLAKAVAGLNAHSKAKALGIAEDTETPKSKRTAKKTASLLGRAIPLIQTEGGPRAAMDGKPISASAVDAYLHRSFGEHLERAQSAMEKLAASRTPKQLSADAYALYERFRPSVARGTAGWGAKGTLDLGVLERLSKEKPSKTHPDTAFKPHHSRSSR